MGNEVGHTRKRPKSLQTLFFFKKRTVIIDFISRISENNATDSKTADTWTISKVLQVPIGLQTTCLGFENTCVIPRKSCGRHLIVNSPAAFYRCSHIRVKRL